MRAAYGIGIALDALAFVQMAFPGIGRRMLGVTMPLTPDYRFAIELGAGLMLAWTLLLLWAAFKPTERRMVLPLTMIIIAWNAATLAFGVRAGLVPAASFLPQIVAIGALFFYCGFCFLVSGPKAGGGERT